MLFVSTARATLKRQCKNQLCIVVKHRSAIAQKCRTHQRYRVVSLQSSGKRNRVVSNAALLIDEDHCHPRYLKRRPPTPSATTSLSNGALPSRRE